jgi:AAA domain, putative AbiEii toxin, Type IV TA system
MNTDHNSDADKLLRTFTVHGLHGDRDVTIKFDGKTRIVVAANGAGKTSVINLLYHFLQRNFYRLSQYEFEKIEVEFTNGKIVCVTPEDLESELPDFSKAELPIYARRLFERVPSDQLTLLLELFRSRRDLESLRTNSAFTKIRISSGMTSNDVFRALTTLEQSLKGGLFNTSSTSSIRDTIEQSFPHELLFLPTYRRVEEDLSNLGLSVEDGPTRLNIINFGMSDVRKRFDLVMRSISESSLIFYQQMSGRMLDELMKGLSSDTLDYAHVSTTAVVAPLLKRFASSISSTTRQEIIDLTASGRIREAQYRPLAYFISRLVEIDRERQQAESYVIRFCDVVNGYFEDKSVQYNNDAMTITVVNKKNNRPIALDKLSSGEKQLISLFSQIYLGSAPDLAVLFDEPELSLSIDWQKKILPDILNSGRCRFLLVATHSPFIFDNELERHAQPMLVSQRDIPIP